MIDRELLAQVMRSHIDQSYVNEEEFAALEAAMDIRALMAAHLRIAMETGKWIESFGSALAIGFQIGREYESLAGREYRSKLTEPFGGL